MVDDSARRRSSGGDGAGRREVRARERRRAGRQSTALMLGVLTTFVISGGAASTEGDPPLRLAQRASTRISVPNVVVAEPASQVRLSIQVEAESLPAQSYVLVRGLPSGVSLGGGHAIGAGSWAVPLYALPTLPLNIPVGSSGRWELVVSLVSVEGAHLAEVTTVLAIGPTAAMSPPVEKRLSTEKTPEPAVQNLVPLQPAGRPEQELSSSSPSPSRPRAPSAEERALAERLVAQGERYFALGDIASARLLFRRAANG